MPYCRFPLLALFISLLLCRLDVSAQEDSIAASDTKLKRKEVFSLGLGLQHGFIFAHSEEVENTKGSQPTGLEGIISWQRVDSAVWSLCHCYPRSGLMLSYYDYDNRVLGKSVTLATFLEPTYRISKRTSFSFKGAMGLSYLTHPFDSIKNPANRSYSTKVNGYLLVGVGAWVQVGKQWWLNPSVNYQHISNGGMREPNKGINWPTAGLVLSYQKAALPYYRSRHSSVKFWKTQPLRYDIALFGTARRNVNERGKSERMPLLGVGIGVAKQVGRINMITGGIEASRDEELRTELQKDSLQASAILVSALAGHEFLLGKFLFSQQLGFYVFNQTPYYDRLYHRWTFTYKPGQRLAVGFSLKAHRHVADYLDLRIRYFLQGK
jgi:hypothetical protein